MASFTVTLRAGRLPSSLSKLNVVLAAALGGLMPAVGQLVVQQTRRRIKSEKTDPDGNPWRENIRGNSIMVLSGALAASIHHRSSRFRTVIGPGKLPYARIHQAGGTIRPNGRKLKFRVNGRTVYASQSKIPRRAYMGLSAANIAELKAFVDAFVRNIL